VAEVNLSHSRLSAMTLIDTVDTISHSRPLKLFVSRIFHLPGVATPGSEFH